MEEFRLCKHCNKELPLTSEYFYKNKTHKGGFDNKCKECKRKYDEIYQKKYYENKLQLNKVKRRVRGKKIDKMSYTKWRAMIERCQSEIFKQKYPTYKDCSVCEKWQDYYNFKEWYDENYYEIDNEAVHLDKDILVKGNKIYSPDTCVFAPQRINGLFTKSNKRRNNLPIGVKKEKDIYIAQCSTKGKNKQYLGGFKTSEEAFNAYKQFKEEYIKEIADEYKDRIPQKLYDAMYRYEVEITD